MFTLLIIWVAGGFASLGALHGVTKVEDAYISNEVKISKFVQSWYAFGELVGIMLGEIGNKKSEEKE
jgi:hypothetical protein